MLLSPALTDSWVKEKVCGEKASDVLQALLPMPIFSLIAGLPAPKKRKAEKD